MSVITFPITLTAAQMRWEQFRNDTEFRSSFGAQAVEVSPPLWMVSMTGGRVNDDAANAGVWQALMLQLRGRTNQLGLWNLMRPNPLGTMRGSMLFNLAPAAGATLLSIIAAGQAAKTLVAGDYLGFGSGLTQQVVMVAVGGTSDGSGIISVTVEPALRNAFLAGNPVTWDKPQVLFRRQSNKAGWDYSELFVSGFGLDLIEDVRL
jgi:hypothetical protein